MSDIVNQAATAVVDTADSAITSVIDVLKVSAEAAETIAEAPINVAGQTFKSAMEEIEKVKDDLFRLIHTAVGAVTEPLP